ncbi:MAG: hypothetical protein K2J37_05335 [Ruminococcus sp.]|nr:hypothetical protein [Ruminococcus sp.]
MALDENPLFTTYNDIISWYIRKNGVTKEIISARTGIAVRTLTSLFSKNAASQKHSIRLLIALAVGLKMLPAHAELMINLNGQFLRDSDITERYYKYLISAGSFGCVAACNDFLVEHGFKPLTDNENISIFE